MANSIKTNLVNLSDRERGILAAFAKKKGMTVEEWIEFWQKAQIYRNAEEILCGEEAA